MSEPATKRDVTIVLIALGLIMLIISLQIARNSEQTRRCIVESRNSVEVPEVCK